MSDNVVRRRPRPVRRLVPSSVAAALLLLAPASVAGAQPAAQPLPVVAVDTSAAPEVRLVVAAPPQLAAQTLDASAFQLSEGGARRRVDVQALPADQLEVALVIDTSGSMAGAPLAAAKSAARSLLDQLPRQVPVAVVGFGATPAVVSPRSSDRAAQLAAVDGLRASGETALYDAVTTGLRQLPEGGPGRRFVVLLSDGGDTASRATLDAAVKGLTEGRVTLFAVELRTPEANSAALARLASSTGGQAVSAADPSALTGLFDGVAKQLVRQYALAWRSPATGTVDVHVVLEAAGVRAEAHPRLDIGAAAAGRGSAGRGSADDSRAASTPLGSWALVMGSVLVALALLVLLVPALALRTPRSAALGGGRRAVAKRGVRDMTERAEAFADRVLERGRAHSTVNDLLERAGLDVRPGEFLVLAGGLTVSAALVVAVVAGPLAGLLAAAAVAGGARAVLGGLAWRRRQQFTEQLADTLQMLSSSLRAGYGLAQAIDVVGREAESPTADEFRRLTVETRLGRDFVDALEALAARVRSEDFEWVVQAFAIHREIGGDLAEVLETVGATIRDRNRVRRQVKALSAEGRMSAAVLFALPFALALLMSIVNPGYLAELTESGAGIAMVVGGALLMSAGGLWLRHIVRPNF